MGKNPSNLTSKRPSLFVLALGCLLGSAVVGYGAIMLFLHPTGIGPCRRSCGLEQAMLTFLGQPLYNLILGLVWVALGLSLMAFLIFLRARR
ncbi:hypothetical protein [Xanthomonas bundabergensis]|uniref:hypothetical protein n=1 Tax=Xanthomonas bundabergensis TaxID=3160842 RepID=UPI0035164EDB